MGKKILGLAVIVFIILLVVYYQDAGLAIFNSLQNGLSDVWNGVTSFADGAG